MDGLKLTIDPLQLEMEWMEHPGTYGIWAEKLADAQAELDEMKSVLDVTRATVDMDVRERPSAYGVDKITETTVANAVTLDTKVKRDTAALNAARKRVSLCKAAVDALEHKKRALTVLAELWIKDYYSELGMPKAEHLTEEDKKAIRSRGRARRGKETDDNLTD